MLNTEEENELMDAFLETISLNNELSRSLICGFLLATISYSVIIFSVC